MMRVFLAVLVLAYARVSTPFQSPSRSCSGVPTESCGRPATILRAAKRKKSDNKFDMKELKDRMEQEANPFHSIFESIAHGVSGNAKRVKPRKVHVIIFNPGTDQQGAHTIEYPSGSGTNVILAFESQSSCQRFASALRAQKFFDPTPQQFELEKLSTVCESIGVFVQVVPQGTEIIPPLEQVKNLGNSRSLRRDKKSLEYIFEMLDSDLEVAGVIQDMDEFMLQ